VSPNDEGYARQVSVLVVTDERFWIIDPGGDILSDRLAWKLCGPA